MKLVLLSAALVALAAPAAAQDPGCFFVRDVGGRSVLDEHTIYFGVLDKAHMTTQAYYRVQVSDCPVVPGSNSRSSAVGLFRVSSEVKAAGRSEQVCGKDTLKISTGTSCKVESFEKMTPQEVAAIPRKLKPSR